MRQILHVDMDAFFASVEQLDEPRLRDRPVLVGGAGRRGVVAAASYEARVFGVRSAMPMVQALQRCPEAIVCPPRMARYAEVSGQVFSIFERYSPLVEGLSFDEAFVDVTASQSLFGNGVEIARRIKADIHGELGLTASAGVAQSKFVAKIASDMHKPDGLTVVEGDPAAFLSPLPLERMWGVGKVAADKLRARGLTTIGDLAKANPGVLRAVLGRWGDAVQRLARGEDDRPVVPDREAKSIGAETTFDEDLVRRDDAEVRLLGQCQRVAQRLTRLSQTGHVVTVKLKYADFSLTSRQKQLSRPARDTDTIFDAVRELLDGLPIDRDHPVRLTGVSVSGLSVASTQQELFADDRSRRREAIESLTANLADRFGDRSITRASLLNVAKPANPTKLPAPTNTPTKPSTTPSKPSKRS